VSANGPPSVVLEGVSRWYGEVLGLNDVSAVVGPGVTGLLGPNGAGKSTLLKLACGMLRPSLGRVLVNGEAPFDRPAVMRRLGVCPEQDALYPDAPILDVIAYLTRLHGYGRAEARTRARRALERAGLGEVLDRSALTFSKGMRQRAKLAQALAHEPDVLVLDEPLNGLDPTGRREFAAIVRERGEAGCAVLVSSHVLHEVEALAGRVLFLHHGRVLAEGSTAEIRRELPEHPLTVRVTTPRPAELARALVALEGIDRLAIGPKHLEVRTRAADALFEALGEIGARRDPPVEAIVPTDEDLEAVFRYLTR
jgi:ABC-2 type transport system ATP-binding protein